MHVYLQKYGMIPLQKMMGEKRDRNKGVIKSKKNIPLWPDNGGHFLWQKKKKKTKTSASEGIRFTFTSSPGGMNPSYGHSNSPAPQVVRVAKHQHYNDQQVFYICLFIAFNKYCTLK